jgi:DNA-binding NtrC family response regulator
MHNKKNETKILIIDSDKNSCFLYEEFLQEKFVCLIVNDELKAIEILKSNSNIGLIITEIRFKSLDCNNLFYEIKKIKINIPIFVCTSIVTDEIKNECLKIGFNEFISKPISENRLCELITKYLSTNQKINEYSEKTLIYKKENCKLEQNFETIDFHTN